MDKIKPCPFCGGKSIIDKTSDGLNWQIVCRGECRCMSAYFAQKEKAIAAWNRRAERLELENNVDTCVCCGEYVPEGMQVCRKCEKEVYMKRGNCNG